MTTIPSTELPLITWYLASNTKILFYRWGNGVKWKENKVTQLVRSAAPIRNQLSNLLVQCSFQIRRQTTSLLWHYIPWLLIYLFLLLHTNSAAMLPFLHSCLHPSPLSVYLWSPFNFTLGGVEWRRAFSNLWTSKIDPQRATAYHPMTKQNRCTHKPHPLLSSTDPSLSYTFIPPGYLLLSTDNK